MEKEQQFSAPEQNHPEGKPHQTDANGQKQNYNISYVAMAPKAQEQEAPKPAKPTQ
jgi:hypothetical protein